MIYIYICSRKWTFNALNVYQINLYQHLNFIYKIINKQTPKIFNDIIGTPVHQYPTKFSKANFRVKRFALRSTKYSQLEDQKFGMNS